jgi:phosphoglycerol transferase MdoB-like AlkP superfamily enzyme
VHPFGGNTANTEFEVLTGFSMDFLPPGSSAYSNYYNRQLPSLPLILKDKGYYNSAIHSFERGFWSRSRVYDYKGFDNFITNDSFDAEKDIKGWFLSEDSVVDMIIKDYETNKKTNEPYFAHVVTMQNHGSYQPDRYGDEQEIQVLSSILSEENKKILETYTQGVKDSSDAFVKLINYFRNRKNPVVIVFYGDHLGMIGENNSVYQETGFISDSSNLTDSDNLNLRRTPFYIWNSEKKQGKNVGTMNAFYLTPFVLNEINMPKSPIFFLLG